MRTFRACLVCLWLSVALLGCATDSAFKDIKIETEANAKVNAGAYDTYAWVAAAAAVLEGERQWNPPDLDIGAEITFLVDRELRAKGMTQVTQSPEVLVLYGVGVDMTAMQEVDTTTEGGQEFENIPQGGVLVILVDAATAQPIWAGSARANISEEPSAELAKKRLDHAVTQMFKRFPS
ncbi:MAG: DUF4136 domain-containing protein [Planctomycetota bacterium]|jgi:hypothetical protein